METDSNITQSEVNNNGPRLDMTNEEILNVDLPFFAKDLKVINSDLISAIDQIKKLTAEIKTRNTTKGVSFLDSKNVLLSTYLLSIARFMRMRASGEQTDICGPVKDAATCQLIINKMGPIEGRIKGQIDALLHSATTAAAAGVVDDVEGSNSDAIGNNADDLFNDDDNLEDSGNEADELFDDDKENEKVDKKSKKSDDKKQKISTAAKTQNRAISDLIISNAGFDSKMVRKTADGKISEDSLAKLSEIATAEFEKKLQEEKSKKALEKLKKAKVARDLLEEQDDAPRYMISGTTRTTAMNEELRQLEETGFRRFSSKKYRDAEKKAEKDAFGVEYNDYNMIDDIEKMRDVYKDASYTIEKRVKKQTGVSDTVRDVIQRADEAVVRKTLD